MKRKLWTVTFGCLAMIVVSACGQTTELSSTPTAPVESHWVQLAPDVWAKGDPSNTLVGIHTQSREGLLWAAHNIFVPAMDAMTLHIAIQGQVEPMRQQMVETRYRIAQDALFTPEFTQQTITGCVPHARASAGPTTSEPGAKANASARSCVTRAEVVAVADNAPIIGNSYSIKVAGSVGQSVSKSAVAYANGSEICQSFASAYSSSAEGVYDDEFYGTNNCI